MFSSVVITSMLVASIYNYIITTLYYVVSYVIVFLHDFANYKTVAVVTI